ncbi:hypothetical protein [Nucisporomicrobium flavum]|uniref:hypothetical protein n=1 Tax=Nucisporomicrobium flavum TaxID=2785915 RepID=UPI0018F5A351|nr:hypothetical protein [Nucisporomicrobium flavum]
MTVRRTPLGAVLGVLVLAAVAFAGCDSDGEPDTQACRLVAPTPSAGPADSSAVKVTEQGYTTVAPDFPRNSTDAPRVSIGAVLQNTSDQVAYRTRVVFDALDASGTSVISGPQATYKMIEVPILLPGATIAVGDTLVADEKSTVAKVSVTPAVTAWLPPGDANNGLARISATPAANPGTRAANGSATVAFTIESGNCTDLLSRGITFAWRDAAGKLVGGNTDAQTKQSACQTGGANQPITAMSQPNTVPVTADLAKTDITALCDVAPGAGAVSSGQPIN